MEEPIDVHPGRGGWMGGYPKACNASMPATINEDVRLDERERMINVWVEEGANNLEVSVNKVKFVHVFYAVCYFRELVSDRKSVV